MAMTTTACHEVESYDNTATDNFESLWQLFDRHYCFFDEKGVDWNDIHDRYAPMAEQCRTQQQLFMVCSEMLDELKDGHVNLGSSFDTYYYRDWWSGYPQNFDLRVLQQNYLHFGYKQLGSVYYATLPQNIGYVYIGSFSTGIGEGNLDNILASFDLATALIIDVRDNGGGDMTNVETWVRRFITQKTLAGYIMHKNGPGHNDFSEPYAYYYTPPSGHRIWTKPVAILTNRSTFSAANNFVSNMKLLPRTTIIGDTTGGGSGMPLSYEMPCGWTVRMSAAPLLDAQGQCTEFGVEPTEGFRVSFSDDDIASGRDPILERAIRLFNTTIN